MKLYQVVVKDVMRRKKRVLYATIGVVIGTMTVVALLTIAQAGQARIYAQLEKYGANLTVVPSVKNVSMALGDLSLGTVTVGDNYIAADKLAQIQSIADTEIRKALDIPGDNNIAIVAPKLYLAGDVKGTPVMLVGIEPGEESKLKTWWEVQAGKYLEGGDQALVGATAAEVLNLKPGDTIDFDRGKVTVAGILDETGAGEDYQIFLPLGTLQNLFGKEGLVSSVEVRALCNACPVEYIADAINQTIPGVRAMAVKQVANSEMGMLEKINQFMLALAGITLLVGGFGVVNTLMTSVHERAKDIGIMRAVGASRNQIIRALIYEAIIIGLSGGILGYGVGTLMAYAVGPLIFEGTIISYVPQYIPLSLGLALLVAVLATWYPAFRATRIRVADSFRSL